MSPNEAPFPLAAMNDKVQRALAAITTPLLHPADLPYLSPKKKGFNVHQDSNLSPTSVIHLLRTRPKIVIQICL